jgi:hypothetical protein
MNSFLALARSAAVRIGIDKELTSDPDKFAGIALSFLDIFARLDYGWFDD